MHKILKAVITAANKIIEIKRSKFAILNGIKKVKMDINNETFFQYWFHTQHHTDPKVIFFTKILEL